MKSPFPTNLILIASVLLASCSAQPNLANHCLPPIMSVGYPFQVEQAAVPIGIKKEIPSIWDAQLTQEQIEKLPNSVASDIASSKGFIWYTTTTHVISYQISTKKIETYDLSAIIPENGSITSILLGPNNMVWVTISGSNSNNSPIARYNPVSNSFQLVQFMDTTNNAPLSLRSDIPSPPPGIYEIDPDTLLLFLYQNLWFLDVKTLNAKLILGKPHDLIVYDVAIGKDKTIWLVAKNSIEKMKLTGVSVAQVYILSNGGLELANNQIPDSADEFNFPLAVDAKNKLWVSNLGWGEPLDEPVTNRGVPQKMVMYKLIESPLFIQEGGRATYGYYRPLHVFASTDGNIWFSSSPGLIQLNPTDGSWCLLARGVNAKVTETPDGAIWFFDRQLYKLSSNP